MDVHMLFLVYLLKVLN